jgi:hypothetical protein
MNNLTVERVIRAYEAGVVSPGFGDWGDQTKGCGCAMTAVAIHEKPEWYSSLTDVLDNIDDIGTHEVCMATDVTWAYMLGFTDGFDGRSFGTSYQERNADVWGAQYHMGFDHGQAAADAVMTKYSIQRGPEHEN